MTESLETRRAHLAELEGRDWRYGDCRVCGAVGVVFAPGQEGNVRCGGCRIVEASLATAISRLPAETPPPIVRSGSEVSGPENGAEAVVVAPEMVCEPGTCLHARPAPVHDLGPLAAGHGWRVQVAHSRGVRSGARTVAELWSVRFRRGTWQGYAVRVGDAWKSVCIAGAALPPFLAIGVTELREWLAEPERCSAPEWLEVARRKAAAAELHRKVVRCPGSGVCTWPSGDGEHTHRADGSTVKKVSRKEAQAGA